MALFPRRRCGPLFLVWCLGVWGLTYITYTSKSETDRQKGRVDTLSDGPPGTLFSQLDTMNTMQGQTGRRYLNSTVIQEEMSNRRALISRYCEQLRLTERTRTSPFSEDYLRLTMVNKDKKLMFCYIPKVANTNFRRVFLHIQGLVRKEEMSDISGYEIYTKYAETFLFLNTVGKQKRKQMLKEYTKVLFVREPLERLLSGYRNKFFHPNERQRKLFTNNYQLFYQTHPDLLIHRGKPRSNFQERPLTFREFLVYFTDSFDKRVYINEHFVPTFELSNPCEVQYDYIGKYESLHKDARLIFQNLGIDIEFPKRNDNYTSSQTVDLVESYYRDIPDPLFKKVWTYLQIDSILFGYSLPDWAVDKLK